MEHNLNAPTQRTGDKFSRKEGYDPLVGNSPQFKHALKETEHARDLRILFLGETGVGKTPFARYSNQKLAARNLKTRPFEQVNCAALTPEYFQDVLFGHKRGAFTGAFSDKMGLVEIAHGGDLFLDEVADLPPPTQVMLLTFLDNREYYRLGDEKKQEATIRILAATNRDLPSLVREGKFRKDLYSRLGQVIIQIPPLRERPEDIPELCQYFLNVFSKQYGFEKQIHPDLVEWFKTQTWNNGNVRELKDCLEKLFLLSGGDPLITQTTYLECCSSRTFFSECTNDTRETINQFRPSASHDGAYKMGLDSYLAQIERNVLSELILNYRGHRRDLARQLRTSRSTLYRKLKFHGIDSLDSEPEIRT